MTNTGKNSAPEDEQRPREVEFLIVTKNAYLGDEKPKSPRNTGMLVDLDGTGAGMLTRVPLQPGDMVRLDHEGTSKLGVVMWSVESSNNFRVQMRFL